jgi:pyruvate formate lyase activating enzyme
MKEAMLYEKLPGERVRCNLCAHGCIIAEGRQGVCQVRENEGGTLYTWVYGQ